MGVYWSSGQRPTVNPRALIFDMDGVIVDSEALHESAKRQALRSAGIEVDELVFAQYTGRSDRAMITDLAKVRGRSDDEVEAILLETQRLYALGEPQLRPITGAVDFLYWARKHYRLAIATSATPRNRASWLSAPSITEELPILPERDVGAVWAIDPAAVRLLRVSSREFEISLSVA